MTGSRLWLLAAIVLAALPCGAAQCSVGGQGVSFGGYDPFTDLALDGTGTIPVSCDVATPYTVSLSTGNGSYVSRFMASGEHRLGYNLFTDATRTTPWGDGTGGSATVGGSATSANHTVYGRIPARQNARVGSYLDMIVVTVTF